MTNLANSYGGDGRQADALKLREQTVALQKVKLGPDHPDTLMGMHNLANSYAKLERGPDALKLNEETLARRKVKLGVNHPDTLSSMWSVASNLIKLDRGVEALPIIDECLARAVGRQVHRNFHQVAEMRLRHFEQLGDAAGCRATAEMWEKLKRTDADSFYWAACFRAVTAKLTKGATTSGVDAMRVADEQADLAMAWLGKAVAAGYKDVDNLRMTKDLDAVRDRDDFKRLILEVEGQKLKAR